MTTPKITAAWLNGIISNTNTVLGTNIANVTANTLITSAVFTNLIKTASNAAELLDYDINWPPLTAVAVGQEITLMAFPTPVPEPATNVRWTTPGTYPFTVPANVHSVMVNWAVGGGGAGGWGTQLGSGGGGGGGGSGGFKHYSLIPCSPGDVLTIVVGAGGQPSSTYGAGGAGGVTSVALNGAVQVSVSGGQGGAGCTNTSHGSITAPGGLGGNPNGLQGQTGPAGANDYASSYGGGGGPGALQGCYGGPGGRAGAGGDSFIGASAGGNGVGPGSGGGGGGSADRVSPGIWAGGNGSPGYVEITYPSQGSTGGTLAQNNSGYAINAVTVSGVIGGYPTGGSGYSAGNASGIASS